VYVCIELSFLLLLLLMGLECHDALVTVFVCVSVCLCVCVFVCVRFIYVALTMIEL